MINHNYSNILKAVLLLILGISSNFLGTTLGCQFQNFMRKRHLKHIIMLFLIYFTIDFTQYEEQINHPITNVFKSIFIWLFFQSFSHLDLVPSVLVLILLISMYFIYTLREYYGKLIKKKDDNYNELLIKDKNLKNIEGILTKLITSVCIIFSIKYYFEKKKRI